MNTNEIKFEPVSFRLKLLGSVRALIDLITRVFFKICYGSKGNNIPKIQDDILKQPAIEVARKIRSKQIKSEEVVKKCIKRIEDVNQELNCLIENRFKEALIEAKKADELIRSGLKTEDQLSYEKPLLGVPFTTKDSIGVAGLHQTAGVYMRKDIKADKDAHTIKLLKNAGAIILGLTNVPELCMWYESYNKIYGRSNNPYNTNRTVGGSSGGEGCIQAVGGSCFGIGSDIAGSIRIPAFFNGIFGHKPTRQIVSNNGLYPSIETETEDNFLGIGPMTRFATDLKPILKIISGENCKRLNLDNQVNLGSLKIFYQFSNNDPLSTNVDPEIISAMKRVIDHFSVNYKISAEQKNIDWLQKSTAIWYVPMIIDKDFGEFLMKDYAYWKVYREIIKLVLRQSDNTFISLLNAITFKKVHDNYKQDIELYEKIRLQLENAFKVLLGDNGIFLFPTHPTLVPYHNQPLIRPMNVMYTGIFNCLGLPATSVHLGLSKDGLPLGVQIIANHNNDRLCLAVAEELEKVFGGWIPPQS